MHPARKADVIVVVDQRQPGDSRAVDRWNAELLARSSEDVVLLTANTVVSPGSFAELSAVAHSEERIAFVWPLSNTDSVNSLLETDGGDAGGIDSDLAQRAFRGLPRSTTAPTSNGGCIYLRGRVIDAVGLLDTRYSTCQAAIEDWVMRAPGARLLRQTCQSCLRRIRASAVGRGD